MNAEMQVPELVTTTVRFCRCGMPWYREQIGSYVATFYVDTDSNGEALVCRNWSCPCGLMQPFAPMPVYAVGTAVRVLCDDDTGAGEVTDIFMGYETLEYSYIVKDERGASMVRHRDLAPVLSYAVPLPLVASEPLRTAVA